MIHTALTITPHTKPMAYFVYIMASRPDGAIYIGETNNLRLRVEQHRSGVIPGHTRKYNIKTLVWFEIHDNLASAMHRERQLKRWRRDWKNQLITEANPGWRDMAIHIPD